MHLLELLKITNVRERKISNEEGEREKVFGCTNSEVRYICKNLNLHYIYFNLYYKL